MFLESDLKWLQNISVVSKIFGEVDTYVYGISAQSNGIDSQAKVISTTNVNRIDVQVNGDSIRLAGLANIMTPKQGSLLVLYSDIFDGVRGDLHIRCVLTLTEHMYVYKVFKDLGAWCRTDSNSR